MNKSVIYSYKETHNLYDYYSKHDFNPVPIPLDSKNEFKKHVKKRLNLFENHLKIPRKLFQNSNILEFGCNSGENALVNALLGSNLHLCEPNENVHSQLIRLFKKFNCYNKINIFEKNTIEKFKSKKKYDFVIAEGFLSTILNRKKNLLKLTKFLDKNSFLIINHDDVHGCFIENIKKIILKNICNKNNQNIHSQFSFDISKILFNSEYKKLNTKRPIVTWWKDAIVSKYNSGKYNWNFSEIITLLNKNRLDFWSSSPLLDDKNSYSWYKNFNNYNKGSSAIKNIKENILYISTGIKINKTNNFNDLFNDIKKMHKKTDNFVFKDINTNFNEIFNSISHNLLKCNDSKTFDLSNDLKSILATLDDKNYKNLIKAYKKTKILKKLWGNTSLYLCFVKK